MTFIHIPRVRHHNNVHKIILEIQYTNPELFVEQEKMKTDELRMYLASHLTRMNYNVTLEK